MPSTLAITELRVLLPSWQLALRADRKSPATVKAYSQGVTAWLDFCDGEDLDPLTRAALRAFTTSILDAGREPATARSRQLAVRRFTAWLVEEGELDVDPFIGVQAPRLDSKIVEPLTDDQLRAMLKACQPPKGADRAAELRHRRDEALVRLMFETGARAGEVVAIELEDLNLSAGTVVIRRGKGGKGRTVPYGPDAARAIDRYLRLRRAHRLAESPALWLGDRGKRFTYDALHKTLARRAADAGIEGFHPHLLRHTAAHRWLKAGGSEMGLMAVAGWTRPDMLMRYTKAQASERAAQEAARLNLGEL